MKDVRGASVGKQWCYVLLERKRPMYDAEQKRMFLLKKGKHALMQVIGLHYS